MNLKEIKKHVIQTRQTLTHSLVKLNKATLTKFDAIRKSATAQEPMTANSMLTQYKQVTSLAVAGAMVFTSGIFAYQNVEFGNGALEMALNTPTVKEEGKRIESVMPSKALLKSSENVALPAKDAKIGQTMIADRTIIKGSQPFILKTALEDVSSYAQIGLEGYSFMINDKEIGFFKNKSEIDQTLAAYKTQLLGGATVEESYFKERVSTQEDRKKAAFFKGYVNKDSALNLIAKGTDVEKIHTVSDGESFWAISTKYGIGVDNLIKANPQIVPERIKSGDKISLVVAKPLITLCTIQTVTYSEKIPFTTRYKDDAGAFKGQAKITIIGNSGEKMIVAKLVKENGILVKRSIVSEKVTLVASDQVVLQGTKKAPSTAATGKMAKPYSRGSYSSGFGRRWGRMHTGVDWSMPVGSPIYAADGGVVSEAGNDGAYGKCIIINHGNGIKTRYAHNSKLLVKVGDKVFKGQKIANSGNTGRTTGPHLHFEVLKNGTPVNPLKYLR